MDLHAPWTVKKYENTYMISDNENCCVVEVDLDFYTDAPGGSPATDDEMSQAAAIARLIAAAPEMYEALEWMLYVAHDIGKAGGKPEAGEYEAAFDSGKAALAKAEGA